MSRTKKGSIFIKFYLVHISSKNYRLKKKNNKNGIPILWCISGMVWETIISQGHCVDSDYSLPLPLGRMLEPKLQLTTVLYPSWRCSDSPWPSPSILVSNDLPQCLLNFELSQERYREKVTFKENPHSSIPVYHLSESLDHNYN